MQDKVIAVLGLAFKPGTDDVRESPSLFFVPQLREAGAKLKLWDPIGAEKFAEPTATRPFFLACSTVSPKLSRRLDSVLQTSPFAM